MSMAAPAFVLRQSTEEIQSIHFHPTDWLLASGSNKGMVTVWNLEKRRTETAFNTSVRADSILAVSWIGTDGGRLFAQEKIGRFAVWDIEQREMNPLFEKMSEQSSYCQAGVINRRDIGIHNAVNASVEIWNTATRSIVSTFRTKGLTIDPPTTIKGCEADENMVLVGYESGEVLVWDMRVAGSPLYRHKCFSTPIMCLAVDLSKSGVVVGSPDNEFVVFKLENENGPRDRRISLPSHGLSAISIRRDRKILCTGGWDSIVRLWNYRRLKPLAALDYHSKEITSVDFHHNNWLASASRDGSISIWNLYNSSNNR